MLALRRGLDALVYLNEHDGANALDLSRALRMPRATTYRLLKTLQAAGYVQQSASDHRLRLTGKVALLSRGLTLDHLLASVAKPYMLEITQSLKWPVSLSTLAGTESIVRENTDAESPLAADRFRVGYRMSLTTTATGLCILAHLPPEEFMALRGRLPDRDRAALNVMLRDIKLRGYATYDRRRQSTAATSIAVPIIDSGTRLRAALTIRYPKSALADRTAAARFVPVLRDAAHRIAAAFQSSGV